MLKRFTIDEAHLTDVQVLVEYRHPYAERDDLTASELIDLLKNTSQASYSIGHEDHNEFTKLRNHLEELGYIKTERGWWNGDRVLKSFYLNEWLFKKHSKFPSAAAIKNSIVVARKYGYKNPFY